MERYSGESSLSFYRALDLTDEKGQLCGKIMGDLGADVIKIEPSEGDRVRHFGPFYGNNAGPENSLQWWAFNTSKRSITLDLESPYGRDALRKLASTADFLIESYPPGYLDSLGLGYKALAQLNPGLIYVSISHFGQTGPYGNYKGSDSIAMAMGGQMYLAGDADRPPVRIGAPQAYSVASLHAAAGAMVASWHRAQTGKGQAIDISIQAAIPHFLSYELCFWEYDRRLLHRTGPRRVQSKHLTRQIYPCRDGSVAVHIVGGPSGRLLRPLAQWMQEEGMSSDLMEVPWETLDVAKFSQQEIDSWEEAFTKFFLRHTRAELYVGAFERHIPLTPCNTIADLVRSPQLAYRNFWVEAEHPELGCKITYPGPPFKLSETPWKINRCAPRLGEHNKEILADQAIQRGDQASRGGSRAIATQAQGKLRRLPLEGIVVADFSRVLIGPLLGKYLGDFGATVIRVESRMALDQHRVTAPYKGPPSLDSSGIFPLLNSSKLSLGLNLSHPRGPEVAKKLIARSDVVLENFTPGVMEKWGLGYEDLRKIQPGIIMFRHSIGGQSGPYARHPGFGWNVNGLVGLNNLTGWPDREAVGPNIFFPDYIPAFWGVIAILAALEYSRRTGKGQCIDISQVEANLPLLSVPVLDYTTNGQVAGRCGNKSPFSAPHNAYPCRGSDRWCVIAVETQDEWRSMCEVVGDLHWTKDCRFATFDGRKENEEELDCLIACWTLDLTPEEVMNRLQMAGVAAGIVQSIQDLLERDPQLSHRQQFMRLKQPNMGETLHQGWAAKLSLTPYEIRPAPAFGEHTEYVCTEILRMTDEEFLDLLSTGALEAP